MILIDKFPKIEEPVYRKILPDYFYIGVAKDAHLKEVEDQLAIYSRKDVSETELKAFFAAYNEIRNNFQIAAEKIVLDSVYRVSVGLFTVYFWYKHQNIPSAEIPPDELFSQKIYEEKLNDLKYLISKSLIPYQLNEICLQDREPETPKPAKEKKPAKQPKAAKKSPEADTYSLFS